MVRGKGLDNQQLLDYPKKKESLTNTGPEGHTIIFNSLPFPTTAHYSQTLPRQTFRSKVGM
jgi:hypothetical protein